MEGHEHYLPAVGYMGKRSISKKICSGQPVYRRPAACKHLQFRSYRKNAKTRIKLWAGELIESITKLTNCTMSLQFLKIFSGTCQTGFPSGATQVLQSRSRPIIHQGLFLMALKKQTFKKLIINYRTLAISNLGPYSCSFFFLPSKLAI